MSTKKFIAGQCCIALCIGLMGITTYAQPSVAVVVPVPTVVIHTESDFYEPLAPSGEWVVIGSYGRCWRPAHVAADWRPYSNGSWQRTDEGWYWVSDEPWAWATYHYGRWDFTDDHGWYWVPQTQWAPAWVSWHEGGGYVGWAPLQPSVSVSVSGYVGFNQSRISPRAFVFVKQGQFLDPINPKIVVANNTTIIKQTTVISNTKIVNKAVFNGGPTTQVIEKASGRKIATVTVRELRQKQEAPVIARQRTSSEAVDKANRGKKVSTPSPDAAMPRGKKDAVTPEPPKIEKAPVVKDVPEKPGRKIQETPIEKQKPDVRPGADRPPVEKSQAQPKADKQIEQQRPSAPSEKKTQRPAEEKPSGNDKSGANPSDKGDDKPPK